MKWTEKSDHRQPMLPAKPTARSKTKPEHMTTTHAEDIALLNPQHPSFGHTKSDVENQILSWLNKDK